MGWVQSGGNFCIIEGPEAARRLADAALTLRFIGGGRKFWDGSGGSNGALEHFNEDGRGWSEGLEKGADVQNMSPSPAML